MVEYINISGTILKILTHGNCYILEVISWCYLPVNQLLVAYHLKTIVTNPNKHDISVANATMYDHYIKSSAV